jgi:hypothetical protein
MKRIYSLILCSLLFLGSLMPQYDMEELAKTPYLIAHFQAHQKIDTNISFFAFIEEHYFKNLESTKDLKHKNLPFYQHLFNNLIFVLVTFFGIKQIYSSLYTKKYFYIDVKYAFISCINTFQPPRFFN